MKCPRCKIIMDVIRTKSHYGQSILLDQCGECGGIWVDENELFQIYRGEAKILESRPLPKIKSKNFSNKELFCPRHHVKMMRFQDPNFPSSVEAYKCPVCRNFWFERGNLTAWQEYVIRRWPNDENHWVGRTQN